MARLHFAALAAAALTSGCGYHRITSHGSVQGGHVEHARATALMGAEPNVAALCDGHPPAQHRARASTLDTAAAIASLGMIVPVTVDYRCAHHENAPPPTAAVPVALAADEPAYGPTPPPVPERGGHADSHRDHSPSPTKPAGHSPTAGGHRTQPASAPHSSPARGPNGPAAPALPL